MNLTEHDAYPDVSENYPAPQSYTARPSLLGWFLAVVLLAATIVTSLLVISWATGWMAEVIDGWLA